MSQQHAPAVQRGTQPAQLSLEDQIQRMRGEFARAIGGATPQEQQKRGERFARICITAFRQSPDLQKCSPVSILGAMMTCAQLNLEPNTPAGLCYLIPRWNSKLRSMECQFQCGYRGLLELMYRSGAVASFNADVVFRQEVEQGLFSYTSGVRPDIQHHIDLLDNGARTGKPEDIVAAYAAVILKSGEPVLRLVTRKEIDEAMAMSGGKAGPSSVWRSHYASMAIKTAIHRLSKWLPSTKIDDAFEAEAQYEQVEAKVEPQAGISLESMNAMLQMQAQQAVEAPQAAPAVEAAPEPEAKTQTEQEKPRQEPAQAIQQEAKPAARPSQRPAAFRPAQQAEEGDVDDDFVDFLADNSIPEREANEAVRAMVDAKQAATLREAKLLYMAQHK